MKKIGIFLSIALALAFVIFLLILQKPKRDIPLMSAIDVSESSAANGVDYLFDELSHYRTLSPKYLEDKEKYEKFFKKKKLTGRDSAEIKVLEASLEENLSVSIPSREDIYQYVDAIHVKLCDEISDSITITSFLGELGKINPGVNGGDEALRAARNLVMLINTKEDLQPFMRHIVLLNELLYFRYKYYKEI